MELRIIMQHLIAMALIFVPFFIKEGAAMSCYVCDSKNDPDCKEYFDHQHLDSLTVKSTECTVDAAQYCIKTTGVWGGVVGTTRFCSSRDMGNQCQFIRYPDHDRVYRACIYTCSNNHCNAAPASVLPASRLAILLTACLSILFAALRT